MRVPVMDVCVCGWVCLTDALKQMNLGLSPIM